MKRLTQEELDVILAKHQKWLNNEPDGETANLSNCDASELDFGYADMSRANMSGADMSDANMSRANMSRANMSGANMRGANMSGADMSDANMSRANMSGADMSGANMSRANMSGANMSGANMDFSCLPLWCGSLSAHFDDKLLTQIAYHLVKAGMQSKNASEKTKAELSRLIDFANGFHRVNECGAIEKE